MTIAIWDDVLSRLEPFTYGFTLLLVPLEKLSRGLSKGLYCPWLSNVSLTRARCLHDIAHRKAGA